MGIKETVVYAADAAPFWEEKAFQAALGKVGGARRDKIAACADLRGKALSLTAGLLFIQACRDFGIREADMTLAYGKNGQPFLKGRPDVYVSLSHSGCAAVCALSGSPVGVDIQLMSGAREGIARRFFTAREAEDLDGCEPQTRRRLFYRYWTAKESHVKMTGTGLAGGLDTFIVDLEGRRIRDVKSGRTLAWLHEYDAGRLDAPEGYCLTAVSMQGPDAFEESVRILRLN